MNWLIISGAVVFLMVLALARVFANQSFEIAGAHASTSTVSNLGFLGAPLMLAFFGERGAGPNAMAIVTEVMILLSIGGVIMGSTPGKGANVWSVLFRGIVRNPLVIGIALGTAFAAAEVALPSSVERFFGFLGGSAGPTALFALGGTLALQKIDRATAVAASLVTILKLAVYPVVAWLTLKYLFDLEPFWIQAGVMLASLPPAGSNFVLAQRYGTDPDRVSAAIVLSTAISALSVPLAAWLVLR